MDASKEYISTFSGRNYLDQSLGFPLVPKFLVQLSLPGFNEFCKIKKMPFLGQKINFFRLAFFTFGKNRFPAPIQNQNKI